MTRQALKSPLQLVLPEATVAILTQLSHADQWSLDQRLLPK
jgi:hypothetical protein